MHRYPQDKIASYSEFPSKHYSLFKIEDIRVNVTQFRSLSQGYMYLCHMVRAKMTLAHILDASLPSFCLSVVDYRRRILYAPAANFYATRKEDDEKPMPCTPTNINTTSFDKAVLFSQCPCFLRSTVHIGCRLF